MTIHHLKEDRSLTVVTLSLGKQVLAIPAVRLREILDPMPVTRVPGAGPLVPERPGHGGAYGQPEAGAAHPRGRGG